ncbi:MAG: oligosaccharide flippase family protein [Patescibacteria group bacterium]
MGYKQHAIAGFSFQSLQKVFIFLLNFVKIIVLARLLKPSDFGLFSLVMIAIGLTESFTQTGINTTIVQSKKELGYFLNTAWVIAIIRGFIIALIMLFLAYVMSSFYQEQLLLPLITVAALIPIIKGFINPAIAQWQKKFHFAREGLYHAIHLGAEVLIQIILAFLLRSVWALVIGVIVAALIEVLVSFIMNEQRPRFRYQASRARHIFLNAKSLMLASFFAYLNDNADDFIIGKMLNPHQLGIYHNAYSMSHKVNYELSKSAHHGLMPVFASLHKEQEQLRLRQAFKKSILSTFLIGLAFSLPLIIWPDFFVKLILGEQWLEASHILAILVVAGLVHSLSNISYALLIAQKRYLPMNLHLLISLIVMIAAIIVLTPIYGLYGACLGILLARVISLPISFLSFKRA